MHPKALFSWFCDYVRHYNLFVSEEDEIDDNENEPQDQTILIQHEKYSTWLYILLLIMFFYVFFYIAMVKPQQRTVVISDVTMTSITKLHFKHKKTLLCPCSTISVSPKQFVFNQITRHPICTSIFVSQQWIENLYLPNASQYRATDFRTTAHSQFQLLADFCSLVHDIIDQAQIEIENYEFTTVELLSNEELQSQMNIILESIRNSASTRLMSFINYINTNTRSNNFISALNTNTMIVIELENNQYIAKKYPTNYGTFAKLECTNVNVLVPSAFHSTPTPKNYKQTSTMIFHDPNKELVSGFVSSCTPFEGFLSSTLNCLHDNKCLELLLKYFPFNNQKYFNLNDSILFSNKSNLSFYKHLEILFIDDWSITINYSQYFQQCKPLFCSYETIDKTNIYYAITILVSLYGGFTIVLHSITPYIISIILKFKSRSLNININCIECLRKYAKFLKQLNLFKIASDRTINGVKQQQILTRIYIILLSGSLLILLLFHTFQTEIVLITESNPSLEIYKNLQNLYSNTLKCPCSLMIIPYKNFLSLTPILHEVCSSDIVDDRWISIWKKIRGIFILHDWRDQASSQFQLLSDLCRLTNQTIDDAVNRFLLESFVTLNVLTKEVFQTKLNETLNQFFQSITTSFRILVHTTRLFTQVDQPYMGWVHYNYKTSYTDLIINLWKNETNNKESLNFTFSLVGIKNIESESFKCICATDPDCQNSAHFYNTLLELAPLSDIYRTYILKEFVERCSTVDSLLFSTLECFYFDSDCFMLLIRAAQDAHRVSLDLSRFYMRPFVYNTTFSRFPLHTTIKTIVDELMIEQWNSVFPYERFYQSCAPKYCSYSRRIRTKNTIEVIISLVSMIGGLTVSLQLITPYLVKISLYLWSIIIRKRPRQEPQSEQQVRQRNWDRLKIIIGNLMTMFYTQLINLNIFSSRDFDSRMDRITTKRLGQWSTRLHFILLINGIVILILYAIVQPQTTTKDFREPSFDLYKHLIEKYGNQLKCLCSSIASKHERFVTIKPRFHQICSSPFASDQWRVNITLSLTSHFSNNIRTDYRRFLSAHLQFLHGLCQLSTQLVNNFVDQFHTSLFTTTELLSEKKFYQRLNLTTEQGKFNIPIKFNHLLFLIRRINHGNAIISTYGTNFEYIVPWDRLYDVYAPVQAIIYNDNCSCGLHSNCITEATFIEPNSSKLISLTGLKIGCTPSESFLASTLECFYNQSCIDLIEQYMFYTNNNNSSHPLSITASYFSINTTISELIKHLFVDEWLITNNYVSYFQQCKPFLCSYTYIKQFSILYTVTTLLALQGGLTIVLRWISPKIIQIIANIYYRRKQRTNIVQPTLSNESMSVQTVDANINDSTSNLESIPTNEILITKLPSSTRYSLQAVIICMISICVIIVLTLFSIYFPRQAPTTIRPMINTTTDTISTTTKTTCDLKFQTIYTDIENTQPISPVIADFNGDNHVDLAFYCVRNNNLHVFLGDGNGTFKEKFSFVIGYIELIQIITTDFDNDHRADLVFTNYRQGQIGIFLRFINGTFQTFNILSMPFRDRLINISVTDFNDDNNTDILIFNIDTTSIYIFLGHDNKTFSWLPLAYLWSGVEKIKSIDTVDLNHDGYVDIIISTALIGGITAILGDGNGTLGKMMFSYTQSAMFDDILIRDFNGDTRLDLIVSSKSLNDIRVMLGYGNGYCHLNKTFHVERPTHPFKIATGDFNCDGQLDIVFSQSDPFRISILVVGLGNEIFDIQTVLLTESRRDYIWIDVNDFNGDSYDDIIVVDGSYGCIVILLNVCECCIHENL